MSASAAFADPLQGDWTTYRFRNQGGFAKVDLSVKDKVVEQTIEMMVFMPLFPAEGIDLKLRTTIETVTSESDAQGRSIQRLKMRLAAFQMRFNSVRETAQRNLKAYCGITDWVAGEFRDIAGKTCTDNDRDGPVVQPAVGAETDHLVHVDGDRMHMSLGLEGDDDGGDDDGGDDIPIDWEHTLYKRPTP